MRHDIMENPKKGLSVFQEERNRLGAAHIGRMAEAVFNRTDVNDVIDHVNRGRLDNYPMIEGRLGDPPQYNLGPYEGYHRHLQRYVNFNPAKAYDGYLLQGDESLKERFRQGHRIDGKQPHVPPHIEVFITNGVAGGLRLISEALLCPPNVNGLSSSSLERIESMLRSDTVGPNELREMADFIAAGRAKLAPDNMVMPLWTYVSHLAETFRSHGDVKLCKLKSDGQVDTEHLFGIIDRNTRAVLFATVGNPLSVAMEPAVFDDILRIVQQKMCEFEHPIVVIADIIYEHFRRDKSKRIDPIQRALHLDCGVPVVETSSMSKMMAIPGQRVGYLRIHWDPAVFPCARRDLMTKMDLLYWPTLGPVNTLAQRALGSLYSDINAAKPVEEELAPFVAILSSLKDLTDQKGKGDKHLLFSQAEIDSRLKEIGIPDDSYSSSKLSSRTRKLANRELLRYGVDITSDRVIEICGVLSQHGYIEAVKHGSTIFYKLVADIPDVKRDQDGKLMLYGIAGDKAWADIGKECGIQTEDVRFQAHKEFMRNTVFERVDYFSSKLDEMRKEGLGIYLHPAYYDANETLVPDRFNAFYVLWGLDKFRAYSPRESQAARVASMCVQKKLKMIVGVPAEKFVTIDARNDSTSYIRTVALMGRDDMDEMLEIIRVLATEPG
jgi:hypothetical protein